MTLTCSNTALLFRQAWQVCCGQHQWYKGAWQRLGGNWYVQKACLDLFLTWVLPQLRRWKAWARKTLPQEGRRMRSRILTSEENTTGQRNTEEDVFLRTGFINCILPVHSIFRLKITDTVVLLWWIMKLQIFGNQVFRVAFWKETHLFFLSEVAQCLRT